MRTLPFRLGRFTLFHRIGTGGMADLYLARVETELAGPRLVVVKEVLPQIASDARFERMLIDEAKLVAGLHHSNIARVEELGRHDGSLFMVMEYVEGIDLRTLLKRCSAAKVPFPTPYRLHVVLEVLRALDYAHRHRFEGAVGIVHRDVSPSNVLLSFDGDVKLCDFGIASAIALELAPSATFEGKAGYMSPEHARGESVDERADLFALGVILWELATGRRLYKATPERSQLELARLATIPDVPFVGWPDDVRLRGIAMRALALRPEDRYPSADAMFDDLYAYAVSTQQLASVLRFGAWLSDTFAADKRERTEIRERALNAPSRPEGSGPSGA